jgi:hypothetical protein
MQRKKIGTFTFFIVVVLTLLLVRTVGAKAATSVTCAGTWQIVPSPNVAGAAGNALLSVAATSTTDSWAVGYSYVSSHPSLPLIEHWNGSSWRIVSGPQPYDGYLRAVAVVSPTSAWAVGDYVDQKTAYGHALIEHWNGTKWSMISHPEPTGGVNAHFSGITALSTTNVWAVGWYVGGNGYQALIEHWNGTQWKVVKSPYPGPAYYNNYLYAISAHTSSDIWAVGNTAPNGEEGLIEHWNGTSWSVVPSPDTSAFGGSLVSVTALSSTNAWAVGNNTNQQGNPLIEHWNGSSWGLVSAPQVTGGFQALTALSSTNIWAVGQVNNNGLTAHWNGASWSQVSNPSPFTTTLQGVTTAAGKYVWTVGYDGDSGGGNTLTEVYC